MKKQKASAVTYLMLFFGMALFGSATPLSRLVTQAFPVFIAGGLRVSLAFLVLAPFIKLSNLKRYKGRDRWLLIGIALLGVLGFTTFMLYGMKMVDGVTGSIVMSSTPAITATLSVIVFKDQVTPKKVAALLLAIAGVLLLQLKGAGHFSAGGHTWLGIILIFAAVCSEAGYTLMGKALTKSYPAEEISGFSALIAAICFIPFCIWQYPNNAFNKLSAANWLYLAAYGLVTMGLGSVLWYKGIKRVDGSVAAGFMGVMPVSALVLSYVLLGERFHWIHAAGFALVFVGVLLMISVHRREMA